MSLTVVAVLAAALAVLAVCLVSLRRSRARQRSLWGLTGEGLAVLGLDGRIRSASDALGELLGTPPDRLSGTSLTEFVHASDREHLLAALNPLAPDGEIRTAMLRIRAVDGSWTKVRLRARVDRDAQTVDVAIGEPGGSERAASSFERVFAAAPIGMAIVSDGIVRRANRALGELAGDDRTGADLETLVGHDDLPALRDQLARLAARELNAVDLRAGLRRADGDTVPALFSVSLLRDDAGEPRQYIVQVQSVPDTEHFEEEVRHAENHDSLTGLLNRAALLPLLRELPGAPTGFAVVDVDGLGAINDTYGTAAGDVVLEAVATRLNELAAGRGALARLGADEFGLLLSDTDTSVAQGLVAEMLAAIAARPVEVAGARLPVTACAGIALSDDLLLHAGEALVEAKRRGPGSVVVFDEGMRHRRSANRGWADKVRRSIDSGRLLLDAQPIVDLTTGNAVQHELLLRMRDEDGSVVRPNAFLAPARRHGLMGAIDEWVISQAIELAQAGLRSGAPLDLAVNVSAESLADRSFLARVVERLMAAPDAGQHLVLELTERVALSDRGEAERLMAQLGEFGCRYTLDDFGAGTAALRYLKQLPVDYVKLDGRLTRGMPSDPADRAIAEAVVQAAQKLGKTVIAECVEDEDILGVARELGIDLAQGLHMARPRRAAELLSARVPH